MSPIAASVLALLLSVIAFAPRRWAMLGLMAGIGFLTLGQFVDAFGIRLYPIRILCIATFVRVALRGELARQPLNAIDRLVLIAYGYRALVFVLNGNGAGVNAIGLLIDVALAYFSCRALITSIDDVQWLLRSLVLLLLPCAALLAVEMTTSHNPLGVVGGMDPTVFRNGRPRCMGSFAHSTILGTFGASFTPFYIGMLLGRHRLVGAAGLLLCTFIVYAANSGGPLTCELLALLCWVLWPMRRHMRLVRNLMAALLLLLVVTMHAPIWYLPAKISDFSGGDGWHRSFLMEVAFDQLDSWWLAGMSVLNTKHWFPYTVVSGGADIINYYLDFGIAAGLPAMLLFIALLVATFSGLGRARTALARRRDNVGEAFAWAVGTVIAMHCFNWLGLVYFDQYQVVFLMQMATASMLSRSAWAVVPPALFSRPPASVATSIHLEIDRWQHQRRHGPKLERPDVP